MRPIQTPQPISCYGNQALNQPETPAPGPVHSLIVIIKTKELAESTESQTESSFPCSFGFFIFSEFVEKAVLTSSDRPKPAHKGTQSPHSKGDSDVAEPGKIMHAS